MMSPSRHLWIRNSSSLTVSFTRFTPCSASDHILYQSTRMISAGNNSKSSYTTRSCLSALHPSHKICKTNWIYSKTERCNCFWYVGPTRFPPIGIRWPSRCLPATIHDNIYIFLLIWRRHEMLCFPCLFFPPRFPPSVCYHLLALSSTSHLPSTCNTYTVEKKSSPFIHDSAVSSVSSGFWGLRYEVVIWGVYYFLDGPVSVRSYDPVDHLLSSWGSFIHVHLSIFIRWLWYICPVTLYTLSPCLLPVLHPSLHPTQPLVSRNVL